MNARPWALAGLALLLVGCGGGGGGDAASPVSGLYEGTGGSSRASELLILDDGRYYLVYGLTSASATPVGGVVVGDGTASGTTFASSNAHDVDLQAHTLRTGTLTSTLVPRVSASTAVLHADGSGATYAGSFNTASTAAASLSALAGTYGGELAGVTATLASVLSVDASGVLAGTTTGACSYAGLATPHGGANAYDVSVVLRAGCPAEGTALHGHAFVVGKLLYLVTASGDLGSVVLFSGVKP